MTRMVTQRCWELRVFTRGGRRLYGKYPTLEGAERAASQLTCQWWIRESTRTVAGFRQPDRPTEAARFREQQSDRMVVLRQATTYYKSPGSVLTALPKESLPQ